MRQSLVKPGPAFTPAVDIFESEREITLLADLPGVKVKDLNIDIRDDILTLAGEVESPEGSNEVDVVREYQTGKYFREFTLSEVIDQAKIEDEPAAPRKITIKTE